MTWSHIYAEFAGEHGRTPAEQLAHDRAAHPGAHMMPFILWANRRMDAAKKGKK